MLRAPINPYYRPRGITSPQMNMPQQQQPQQQQSQGGMSPMNALSMYQQFANTGTSGTAAGGTTGAAAGGGSGGGSAGAGAGGLGGAGIGAIIAAAIALQSVAANNNDRRVDGVKSGGIWDGHFTTEPWFALASNKMGLKATAGEKFDAAMKNKDYDTALRRAPAMGDYWSDPARSWVNALGTKAFGEKAMRWIDPISYLIKRL